MNVLLSIKPEFVEKIISGEKRFEFRKRIFKQNVSKVVVYSTMPVGKIVGEFEIQNIINDTPENLWQKTCNYSGITKDFYDSYFHEKDNAYALQIKEFVLYDCPIEPSDLENFIAPQSYKYINDEFLKLDTIVTV